jgi:UDP-N-acetylglucosamine--N-acetylmuramyl-(pentapeptide) pyrophosphoryl-undecaprenol N-acetylglucosamine transferase
MSSVSILLTGGGSGGHVFPLLAVAERLRELSRSVEPVFVGTERGLEKDIVPRAGFHLELMPMQPVLGGGVAVASKGLLSLAKSLPRARALLRQYAPRVVFSIGGYAATPVAMAARAERIPLALMEPNSVPGLSNRVVAPFAQRTYTAFEEVESSFSKKAVMRTGVALRKGFGPRPYNWGHHGQDRRLSVLVLGGSQGARSLNEIVPSALGRTGIVMNVLHQTGKGNAEAVQPLYSYFGVQLDFEVREFIDDMPEALANADLVIARAGAGSIAETCAVGRPSILLPLASAAGNHQLLNARALEKAGAAVCMPAAEATDQTLGDLVSRLSREPARLGGMASRAQAWGRPDATDRVARDLLLLANVAPDERAPSTAPRVSGAPRPGGPR